MGSNSMKKKYFSVVFLVLIMLVVLFASDQSVKVVKRMIVSNIAKKTEGQIIIVIDPGHPSTCLG